MPDYAEWRGLEREFRELCQQQPIIRATETPDGWIVQPINKAERFKALAGIAAQNAGGESPTWNYWLDLLKVWLLETGSDFIDCSEVVSAGGIKAPIPAAVTSVSDPKWPKISPEDRRLKRYTLCTIRWVCEASANYCLELARLSLRPRTHQRPPVPVYDQSREERLQAFVREKHTTIAAVCRAAAVAKTNFQQWRKEALPDCSVMAVRIEDVLSGKRPLKG